MPSPASEPGQVFRPQLGDINQLQRHTDMFALKPDLVQPVADSFLGALTGRGIPGVTSPDLERYRERARSGGTFVSNEVRNLAALVPEFGVAFDGLCVALGHDPQYTSQSVKVYTGRKLGKAPHRDANFANATPGVVDAVGISGTREFGLWAIPQTVDLGRGDKDFMNTTGRNRAMVEFSGQLSGKRRAFHPVSTHTLAPGEGVRIDEAKGAWKQGNDGHQMAIWHSVYATPTPEDPRPVVSAIFRSAQPKPIEDKFRK